MPASSQPAFNLWTCIWCALTCVDSREAGIRIFFHNRENKQLVALVNVSRTKLVCQEAIVARMKDFARNNLVEICDEIESVNICDQVLQTNVLSCSFAHLYSLSKHEKSTVSTKSLEPLRQKTQFCLFFSNAFLIPF